MMISGFYSQNGRRNEIGMIINTMPPVVKMIPLYDQRGHYVGDVFGLHTRSE